MDEEEDEPWQGTYATQTKDSEEGTKSYMEDK
jgi:hypothetical protein